jgi:hypothetical protein
MIYHLLSLFSLVTLFVFICEARPLIMMWANTVPRMVRALTHFLSHPLSKTSLFFNLNNAMICLLSYPVMCYAMLCNVGM